jgi:glycosyltransferase involved in cell wall biosynthesis
VKALFIGPYRQNDGWGDAAKHYAKALSTACDELSIRPMYMGSSFSDCDEDLLEYEFNDTRNYDVIIQNCLPHLVDYDGNYKNILLCHLETSNLNYTSWPSRASLMDEIWVPSYSNKRSLTKSGVNPTKIRIMPIPTDINKYKGEEEPLSTPYIEENDFVFYFIGEYTQRKNLVALIIAFHSEFEFTEPVKLVIKTGRAGIDPQALSQQINQKILNTKSKMRIYNSEEIYKPDILIANYLAEKQLISLHKACDCFVMPSHGESWCIPAFEAMGFGNPVIATEGTGPEQYMKETGWLAQSLDEVVCTNDTAIRDIYTSRETWKQINIKDLKRCMREAYEDKDLYKKKSKAGIELSKSYSYEEVGKTMLEAIKL